MNWIWKVIMLVSSQINFNLHHWVPIWDLTQFDFHINVSEAYVAKNKARTQSSFAQFFDLIQFKYFSCLFRLYTYMCLFQKEEKNWSYLAHSLIFMKFCNFDFLKPFLNYCGNDTYTNNFFFFYCFTEYVYGNRREKQKNSR